MITSGATASNGEIKPIGLLDRSYPARRGEARQDNR